ncbi:transposase, partial [Microcoleus sp. AR_TQ3_B6]|uniref:transposase n=1 Tax=Microcoleus sp. AR_TQ3_B6 TaxID=3055284 RepID=UPI002FD5D31F
MGNWLREKGVSFCLTLKNNPCIETEHLVWQRLDELGILSGTSLYFQGKRVRKTQPATGFDVACKWKRNYGEWKVDEAWFILTDLGSLPAAIDAYKQRMGIEEMFRDCKTVGYDLEGSSLKGERLINMILLMTRSYSSGIFQGTEMKKKQVQKYVSRRKEPKKRYQRRSTFGVGLDGEKWVNYLEQYSDEVEELMKLTPSKRRFYQQGMRAATLIQSIS